MRRNVGGIDRAARIGFGIALLVLSYTGVFPAMIPMVVGYVVGIILLATSAIGYCPVNQLIGFNSCRTSGFVPEESEKKSGEKKAA